MTRKTERILWGITTIAIVCAIAMTRWRTNAHTLPALPVVHPAAVMMFDEEEFSTLAGRLSVHDLFRLDRKPATIAFGQPVPPVVPAPSSPALSSLVLRGMVGGPPWQAVLAGVPNRGTVVVREGDTLAGFRVLRLRRDAVVLKGRDTVMTLTFTRTWQ